MSDIVTFETQRVALQGTLDSLKTSTERNRMGQFATPSELAEEILQYARSLLPSGPIRFLDPALGTGSFFSALLKWFPEQRIESAIGYEIDPHFSSFPGSGPTP